ncbi:MAG: hypothetical protein KJO98_16570, partial [Rhodothermia bacterium]|nr:hypothetical protein [Rhodothermia bacterium]
MDTYYEKLKSLGDHQDQYCAELALAKLLELPPKTVTVEHADLGRCRVVVMRDDAGAFEVPDLDPARLYVFAICDLPQGTVRFQGLLEGAQ